MHFIMPVQRIVCSRLHIFFAAFNPHNEASFSRSVYMIYLSYMVLSVLSKKALSVIRMGVASIKNSVRR